MKKRLLSALLAAAMIISMIPVITLPAAAEEKSAEKEIDQSTYEALGLNLYADEDAAADSVTAPFKEDGVATSIAAREVYVALNAAHGNRYTLRDGLDTVNPYIHDNTRDQHSGAYAFYGGSPSSIKAGNGNTVSSGLSSNKGENVLASQGNDFNGIYATSVALDGGDGKDNYVAELRAYGNTSYTSHGGKDDYAGKLEVVVFKIGDDGSRTEAATLTPKLDDSSFYSNNLAYMTRRYVQELDAYFEIEAGDLNGDGLDDLAVYTGRYTDGGDGRRYALVDVFYATGKGQWQAVPSQEIAVDAGYASSYSRIDYNNDNNWKEEIVRHPVVTIAMGDIDRNLCDEMAVVSSAPANNNDADNVAHFSLLACGEDGSLNPVGGMENVALNDGAGNGLISAGCAFGEFAQIDNDSVSATTLIIGGWSAGSSVITRNEASAGYSQGAYYYVYYDYTTGQYVQSGYRSKDLGGNTKSISQVFNLEGQENGGNGVRVYPTLAPMAVACGDLDGSNVQSVSDQVLFGTQVMQFSLETGFGSELFSFDFCMTQVDDKNNNRDKEQPWIGDVVVGTVDSDPSENGWREMFLFVTGVHRKSEINTSDDYYYMDLGAIWRRETASEDEADKGYFILFEGVMAKSNARNDTYGTFVSLALPDVGNDSVVMKFVDKGIIYTDPEVFAVLQASPYFSDLEEVYGYIGNGGTSYGESQGSSTTGGASISGSYGFYHSATVQAVAAAEYEFSLVATASYDYSYSSDKETAISYNNQAGGGDKVVVYTVPNVLYIYEVYTPGTSEASGTWDQVVMTTPLQAVVTMLDVDAYDEVAASTAGLEPVRGNILYSTPGQPETYVNNQPAGETEGSYGTYAQSSSAGSGSDITQEFSFSETDEHSFSVGFDFNFKVGAGGGGLGNELMFGAMGNIAASGSGGWSRTEGTSFSGTVDALPEEATNYGFSWKLLVNRATLGGNDVWVVGYDVINVVQPPRMPQNLTVTQAGTDYVDLEWESGGNASSYILYQKTTTGNYNQVAVLPYTAESYRHEGRNPNTTYTYAIQAISSSGVGSIYSPDVTATTMSDNASFSIVEHPGDAHAHAGGSAQFEARGSGQGGYGTVGYEWQVNETGRAAGWKKVSETGVTGAASTGLTLNNVTQEMDGWQYRCRIYYDQYELFTAPATLIVNKADSRITMSILDGDSQVTGNTVLSAKGSVITTGEGTVSGRKAVSVTKDNKTYTLLTAKVSDQTYYYWFDGTNYYAAKALPTVSDGLFGTDAAFNADNIGIQQTLTATDYTTTIGGEEVELSGPTEIPEEEQNITIPDPEGGDSYTAKRSWTGDGCTVYEATRTVDGVVETETFYTAGGSTYTVCTVTYTNVITVQAAGDETPAVTLDVSTLATAFQATTSTTTTTQTHTSDGKAYTLTATPAATSSGSASITGTGNRVYFSISNGSSGETVEAVWDDTEKCYAAQWTPTLTGKLTITAVFAGNDLYLSSQSTPATVYSAVQVANMATSSLSMSAPTNMLYWQAGTLAVTKLTVSERGTASSADVTASADYTVEKRGSNGEYATAENTDYTLNGGSFTPLAVGTFRITAKNDNLTASAVISVGKATLTLAAQDTKRAVNGSEREPADVTITTNNGQTVSLTKGIDYTVTSDGTTATIPGTYPIQVALVDTSDTVNGHQANYNIITQGATYTLTSKAYPVTATAGANGSVSISYQADGNSATVPVQSGTNLPEGSQVTVTAVPATGYVVSCWMVNGAYVTELGGSLVTSSTYTISSLDEEYTISVEFALGSSKLTYGAANADDAGEAHGQVTAYYVEGGVQGNTCASGNAVNYNQTVRVAALPEEDYTVHHWTVQKGDDEAQTLMAPDGVSYFTGESSDFSQFSEDMTVTVYFTKEETLPVTIKPVDNGGAPLVNATVTVNGTPLTWDGEKNAFVYEGKTGENLTITVTPPSGVLVQEWTVGEGQTTGSLSNQSQTMTLYNLQSVTDFTVKCAALNTFQVEFGGALEGGDFGDTVGSVTAAKIGATGTNLTSGQEQTQGSAILFTAAAKDGYEIAGWTVNGEAIQATGELNSQTWQIPNLSGDVSVEVTFRAKPVVTITQPDNGTIAVTGTVNGVADQTVTDSGYVDYGTDLTVTVTPADSHVVTKICNTEVNTGKVNGSQSNTVQNVTAGQTISAELTAKPTVTISQPSNGEIAVTGTVNGAEKTLTNGDYVDFGSSVIVTATPGVGYVADTINGESVNENKTNGPKTSTVPVPENGLTVTAVFQGKPVVTINTADGGTVEAKGTTDGAEKTLTDGDYVDFDTDVLVTLSPDKGYVVADSIAAGYTDGTGETTDDKTYIISNVQGDRTITPVWTELNAHAITFSVVDTNGEEEGGTNGTLSAVAERKGMDAYKQDAFTSGTSIFKDSTVTLTATPDEGYRVQAWTWVNDQGEVETIKTQDGSANYIGTTLRLATENLSRAHTITVEYTYVGSSVTFGAVNGTITSAQLGGNEIHSGATLNPGATVTITAQGNPGYEIQHWTVNGVEQADSASDTFTYTAPENGTIGAVINAVYQQVEYDVSWTAGSHGSVSANGYTGDSAKIRGGTSVTFNAVPEDGYQISGWTVNGQKVENAAGSSFTWTVPNGMAETEPVSSYVIGVTFTGGSYTLIYDQPANGTLTAPVESNSTVTGGTQVTFTAEPDEGYQVFYWTVNGQRVDSTSTSHTVTIESNTIVSVTMASTTHTVTFSANQGGSVTCEQGESPVTVNHGGNVTLTATADPYYDLIHWLVNGAETAGKVGEPLVLDNITEDMTVEAVFAQQVSYNVKFSVNGSGGSLSATADGSAFTPGENGQPLPGGSKLVFTAAPDEGKAVKVWTVNGQVQDNLSNTLTIDSLSEITTVTVEFEDLTLYSLPESTENYTITDIVKDPADYGGANQIREGGDVTFTVKPAEGETITALTVNNGGTASQNADGSWTVTVENVQENINLTATVVSGIPLVITETANGTITVKRNDETLSSGAALQENDQLVITAAANSGYTLKSLTVNGTSVTSGSTYTVQDTDHVTIAATFEKESTGGGIGGGSIVAPDDGPSTDGSNGWDEILEELEKAEEGDTIVIDMGGETILPGEILDTIAGKDVTVDLEMGDDLKWTIKGEDLPTGTDFDDLDMGVTMGTDGIPVDVINTITGERSTVQVTLAHDGTFGFKLTLTAPLGEENGGYWANLYHYDEAEGRVRFESAGRISTHGTASLPITHASQYVIVIDNKSHALPFTDVEEDDWFREAVEFVYRSDLMAGVSGTLFAPNMSTTRAMIVTILYRLEGEPAVTGVSSFTDVPEDTWYTQAVKWGEESGVINGYGHGLFGPEDDITREQMATILYRYAAYKGYDVSGRGDLSAFRDGDSVGFWAVNGLSWALDAGLMAGMGNSTLAPQGEATRAQIATILMRFVGAITR